MSVEHEVVVYDQPSVAFVRLVARPALRSGSALTWWLHCITSPHTETAHVDVQIIGTGHRVEYIFNAENNLHLRLLPVKVHLALQQSHHVQFNLTFEPSVRDAAFRMVQLRPDQTIGYVPPLSMPVPNDDAFPVERLVRSELRSRVQRRYER